MEYYLKLVNSNCDPKMIGPITSWNDVREHLINKLDKNVIYVVLNKFSSNGNVLLNKIISMSNIIRIVLEKDDKDLRKIN